MTIAAPVDLPGIFSWFSPANALYSLLLVLTSSAFVLATIKKLSREETRKQMEDWEALVGLKDAELKQLQSRLHTLESDNLDLRERIIRGEQRLELVLTKRVELEEQLEAGRVREKDLQREVRRLERGGE